MTTATEKPRVPFKNIIFVDLETSGLDPQKDRPLEIACLAMDGSFSMSSVIRWPAWELSMPDRVFQMHHKSGLLEELKYAKQTCNEIEGSIVTRLKHHGYKRGEVYIAGFTIGFDRSFIREYMPDLNAFLHYRSIDVSSLQTVVRLVDEAFPLLEGEAAHRALADCEAARGEMLRIMKHLGFTDALLEALPQRNE